MLRLQKPACVAAGVGRGSSLESHLASTHCSLASEPRTLPKLLIWIFAFPVQMS